MWQTSRQKNRWFPFCPLNWFAAQLLFVVALSFFSGAKLRMSQWPLSVMFPWRLWWWWWRASREERQLIAFIGRASNEWLFDLLRFGETRKWHCFVSGILINWAKNLLLCPPSSPVLMIDRPKTTRAAQSDRRWCRRRRADRMSGSIGQSVIIQWAMNGDWDFVEGRSLCTTEGCCCACCCTTSYQSVSAISCNPVQTLWSVPRHVILITSFYKKLKGRSHPDIPIQATVAKQRVIRSLLPCLCT